MGQRRRRQGGGPLADGPHLDQEPTHGDEGGIVTCVNTGDELFYSGVVKGVVSAPSLAVAAPTTHPCPPGPSRRRRLASARRWRALIAPGGLWSAVATSSTLIWAISRRAMTSRCSDVN